MALQFHNFENSPTATYTLTSSILFALVIYVLEVKFFRNFPLPASPVLCPVYSPGSGLLSSLPALTNVLSHQSSDILSTAGYDSIIQHLNNGRKNCKEFEDFLKERYMLFFLEDGGEDKTPPHKGTISYFLCVSKRSQDLSCRLWNDTQEVNDISVPKLLETSFDR